MKSNNTTSSNNDSLTSEPLHPNIETIMGPPTSSGTDLIINNIKNNTTKSNHKNIIKIDPNYNPNINLQNNVNQTTDTINQLINQSNNDSPQLIDNSYESYHHTSSPTNISDTTNIDEKQTNITKQKNVLIDNDSFELNHNFLNESTITNHNHYNNNNNGDHINHPATMANLPQYRYHETTTSVLKKRPGRPKGSKNKPKDLRFIGNNNNYDSNGFLTYNSTQHSSGSIDRESPRFLRRKRNRGSITIGLQNNISQYSSIHSNINPSESIDPTIIYNTLSNHTTTLSTNPSPTNSCNSTRQNLNYTNNNDNTFININDNNNNNHHHDYIPSRNMNNDCNQEFLTESVVENNYETNRESDFKTIHALSTIPASDIFKQEIIDRIHSIADESGVIHNHNYDSNVSCFLYCNSTDNCIERDTLLAKNIVFITSHGFLTIVHQQIYVIQNNNNCSKSHCTYVIHEHSLPIALEAGYAISAMYNLFNICF